MPTNTRRSLPAILGLIIAVLVIVGCVIALVRTPTADPPPVRPGELADADGRPCPRDLRVGDDPSGLGLGVERAADELPTLLEPRRAWVCRYDSAAAGATSGRSSADAWRRAGASEPVAPADLPALRPTLDDLAPADRSGGCNADLGPRWMVVLDHDGDLTGVVVDDFGCRDVRLTDEPRVTPPGAPDQEGTVGGVLDGGPAILDAVRASRKS